MFVKDPDGFLLEFIQPGLLPPVAASAAQNAYASGLGISVNDIGDAARFYREKLGFDVKETPDFVTDRPFVIFGETPEFTASTDIIGTYVVAGAIIGTNITSDSITATYVTFDTASGTYVITDTVTGTSVTLEDIIGDVED